MVKLEQKQYDLIAPLFAGWEETMITSCLQGYHGTAYADRVPFPLSAQIVVGDFCCLAGRPNLELAGHIPTGFGSLVMLMIPRTTDWAGCIEQAQAGRFQKSLRFATRKNPGDFDRKILHSLSKLPAPYTICPIDKTLYHVLPREEWSKDLCSQFASAEDYLRQGIGFVAMYGEKAVAGASSYTVYRDGIEIEVDTHPQHRRRGLAQAVSASLILECLRKGLYPSWDAASETSLHLAQKLGYQPAGAYPVWKVKVP